MEDEVEEEEKEDSTSIAFERSIIQIFGFSLTFGFSLEQMEHDRCWFLFENVHALQTHVVMSKWCNTTILLRILQMEYCCVDKVFQMV